MPTRVNIAGAALENPHRNNPDVHYRLYLRPDGEPTTLCVQDFDYYDYDDDRFLNTEAYDDEGAAREALNELMAFAVLVASQDSTAATLVELGMPVTREQALQAYAARAITPTPASSDESEPNLASQLRIHAFEQDSPEVRLELFVMADRLDGGTGPGTHRLGCPDLEVRTADCSQCRVTLAAMVGSGVLRSMFAATADQH